MNRRTKAPRFAIVTSVDSVRFAARVALRSEGAVTDWLPIFMPWVSAGWNVCSLPATGDQVLVVAQEGSADNGIVVGGFASISSEPPP